MKASLYILTAKRLLLVLAIFFLARILFFIFNLGSFSGIETKHILFAFLHGFRFDISVLTMVNSLFILLSILPFSFQENDKFQKYLKILFFTTNSPLIFLNIIDIEYFKFTGKRTQIFVIELLTNIQNQLAQLVFYYWYILLGFAFIMVIAWFLYPKINQETSSTKTHLWKSLAIIVLVVLSSAVCIRGGFQLRPLTPTEAFIIPPQNLGHLSLNTPYVFLFSLSKTERTLTRKSYFKNDLEAKDIIKNTFTTSIEKSKDNVVIIILESFDKEYLGIGNPYKGYTPFFDSLAKNSLYFPHCFANGRTSIEALPSILASLPPLMNEAFATSVYQTNNVNGLGSILKKEGYSSSFFHGGENGTMCFNTFSAIAGYDSYYGKNEYPNLADFDGNWGIFDEPYLKYFAQQLNDFQQPFNTAIFTLSSHQPYTIPKQHKGKFPKGEIEIHESIGYSDYALKMFFEEAKKMDWYKNTLFVLTADHTQKTYQPSYNNTKGNFSIPLVFFHPSKKLSADTSIITQQTDIMPSILAYLGIEYTARVPFGKSVFEKEAVSECLNYNDGIIRVMNKNEYLEYHSDLEKHITYDFTTEKPKEISNEELLKKAKAYRQYFNNCMIDNQWK